MIALVAPVSDAAAQLRLKPLPPPPAASPALGTCPAIDAPQPGPAVSPEIIDSLVIAGGNAFADGNLGEARLLLRQAAFLDPTNPSIAVRLGAVLENLAETDAAVIEYCRYLVLSPDAADTERILGLVGSLQADPESDRWHAQATAALDLYDRGQYDAAAQAYTSALELRPDWAEAYFNRALIYDFAGRYGPAVQDFERYLQLEPEASDSAAVRTEIARLRTLAGNEIPRALADRQAAEDSLIFAASAQRLPAPGGVLVRGLLIPGLGQYSTGRYVLGTLVAGGVAGALYYGSLEKTTIRQVSAVDPFGNPYQFQARVLGRPNQKMGIGIAAAIATVGAIESYIYARGQRRAAASVGARAGNPGAIRIAGWTYQDRAGFGLMLTPSSR